MNLPPPPGIPTWVRQEKMSEAERIDYGRWWLEEWNAEAALRIPGWDDDGES